MKLHIYCAISLLFLFACNSSPSSQIQSNSNPSPSSEPPPVVSSGAQVTLTILLSGAGSGSVSATGVNCSQNCTVNLEQGAEVNLTAVPSAGSEFAGWSGACLGVSLCRLVLRESMSVTAIFQIRDAQAPSRPTGLTANAVSSSVINLAWSAAADNVGVSGYHIYRNGGSTPIASVNSLSYSNTGLSANTSYTYSVAAFDLAGNISTKSTVVSATTLSPPTIQTYTLGGQITGLSSGDVLVLRANNNAGTLTNVLTLSNAETSYQMPQGLTAGTAYSLQVITSPIQKNCTALNATGVANSNIININITCVRQEGNCARASANLWAVLIRNPAEVTDHYDAVNSVVCHGDNLYVGGSFKAVSPGLTGPVVELVTTDSGGLTSNSYISLDSTLAHTIVSDGQGGWFAKTSKVVPSAGYPPWAYISKTFHILPNRTLDPNWSQQADLGAIAFSDGYLYAINAQNQLLKISVSSGAVDSRFNVSVPSYTIIMEAQGQFIYLGGAYGLRRVRMNADGSGTLDSVWQNTLGNMAVFAMAVAGDGTVYAAQNAIRKVITNANGEAVIDTRWNSNVVSGIQVLKLGSDGALYAGGSISSAGGLTRSNLAKITTSAAGSAVIESWAPSVNGIVYSIALDADQNVFIGGDFTSVNGQARNRAAKLSSSGVLQSWNPNADNRVTTLAISGNRILLGGNFTTLGGIYSVTNLAKFSLTTGALDTNWNPIPNGVSYHDGVVLKLALSEDGKDLYVESYPMPRGDFTIAKISALGSGAVDSTWRSGTTTVIDSMNTVGSNLMFSTYAGTEARLYQMNPDGNTLMNFPLANSVGIAPNTKYSAAYTLYGNNLYYVPPQSPFAIKRMNLTTGIVDSSWQISLGKFPTAMKAHAGNLYVIFFTGTTTDLHHMLRKYSIAEAGAAVQLWEKDLFGAYLSWRPVYDLQAAGTSLYVGGRYERILGQTRYGLAKLSTETGNLDLNWAKYIAGPAHSYTYSIVPVPDDSMVYTGEDNGLGALSVP